MLVLINFLYLSEVDNFSLGVDVQVSKEKILIRNLLDQYAKIGRIGRPVNNTADRITVEFGLSLIQIMDVDEKNQVLETNVWFTYKWKDVLLRWDPHVYDNITTIMVPPENIWIPDIVLYNFADSRLKEQRSALVVVDSTGDIIWMPQAILRSSCNFDTTFFPFDQQQCHLKFGSWTHDGTKLDLQFFDGIDRFMWDDYIPGNEWDIVGNHGARNVKRYECCKEIPYLDLKFFITIKRRVAFYSVILLLPCSLLSTLTMVIFWVPPESPAKLQLGMNIFVAFFVLLLLLAESTPKAADRIPLIGAYFCLSMVMITLSSVLATVVVNMFFRGIRVNRVPAWLRRLMIDWVARILMIRGQFMDKDAEQSKRNNWGVKVTGEKQGPYQDQDVRFAKVCLLDNVKDERVTVSTSTDEHISMQENFEERVLLTAKTTLAEDIRTIREILEKYKDRKLKAEMKDKCVNEWKIISLVTDRLFFTLYVCANITGILILFFGQ
ncbi:hypothetical protein ACJMK2_034697 [Sinanodonta woodiana]|uniref:Uncharacterized protein n=1 Tax=Sinanodonta woodiana TaxID=1069815 RepID=A0ABD3WTW3_SINWO